MGMTTVLIGAVANIVLDSIWELLTKCLTIYYERKNGSKKDAHRRHPIHLILLVL